MPTVSCLPEHHKDQSPYQGLRSCSAANAVELPNLQSPQCNYHWSYAPTSAQHVHVNRLQESSCQGHQGRSPSLTGLCGKLQGGQLGCGCLFLLGANPWPEAHASVPSAAVALAASSGSTESMLLHSMFSRHLLAPNTHPHNYAVSQIVPTCVDGSKSF